MSLEKKLRSIPSIAVGLIAGIITLITGLTAGLLEQSPVDGTTYINRIPNPFVKSDWYIDILPPGVARMNNALPIVLAVSIIILLVAVFTFVYMVLFEGWKERKNFEASGMTFTEYNYRS